MAKRNKRNKRSERRDTVEHPLMVSRHGLTLSYIQNGAVVNDGVASYVDDILDCFDQWDGRSPLKEYIISMLRRELALFNAGSAQFVAMGEADLVQAGREVLLQKIKLLEQEPEEILSVIRQKYVAAPEATIQSMLNAARQGDRHFFSVEINRK